MAFIIPIYIALMLFMVLALHLHYFPQTGIILPGFTVYYLLRFISL